MLLRSVNSVLLGEALLADNERRELTVIPRNLDVMNPQSAFVESPRLPVAHPFLLLFRLTELKCTFHQSEGRLLALVYFIGLEYRKLAFFITIAKREDAYGRRIP